jgi:hypothetical protein
MPDPRVFRIGVDEIDGGILLRMFVFQQGNEQMDAAIRIDDDGDRPFRRMEMESGQIKNVGYGEEDGPVAAFFGKFFDKPFLPFFQFFLRYGQQHLFSSLSLSIFGMGGRSRMSGSSCRFPFFSQNHKS